MAKRTRTVDQRMVPVITGARTKSGRMSKSFTKDSFNNFAAALGIQANNVSAGGSYNFDFITKNRILLEAMYRTSWIIGMAVDVVADDMTQGGISFQSTLSPEHTAEMQEALIDLQVWDKLNEVIKWSRLYGSCLGFLMIEGQDPSTPLRLDTVGQDQFRGILPFDRWQVIPSIDRLIRDLGPNMGMPEYYTTVPDAILPNIGRIHHTRVIRMDAIVMPHYQKMIDNMWGESVVERIHDRLLAFDSTSQGAAQLVYRAYLRTIHIKGLRDIVAAGGPAYKGLMAQINVIRQLQANEGITLLDTEDEFETNTYTFSGLDGVLEQFAQQISGALEIPLVRLLGQAPAGLNSSGESDLRTYYDGIKKKQQTRLTTPVKIILELVSRSHFGKPLPKGFGFTFNPLWQLDEEKKSTTSTNDTQEVVDTYDAGLISMETALKELRQRGVTTGKWSNISDEEMLAAKNAPPPGALTDETEDDETIPGGDADAE